MAVKVLELHHHGIRVGPSPTDVKKAYGFYHDVLGLDADQGRPVIPTIDGFWMDVGGTAQIHLMGVSRPHVALAVPDIQEAKAELDRMGVEHWVTRGVVGPESQQIFMYDPFGNMIELHQAGTCRCVTGNRQPVKGMS